MVKGVVNGVETYYPGRHYNEEVDGSTSTVKKFYAMGSTTVAVRTVTGTEDVLNWVLGDHLGSASVTANVGGRWNSELKYSAFGEIRASNGITPTEYRYTNQRHENSLGLYFYVARWYDSELAHFIQADTLVPGAGNAKAYDRYAYSANNPILYTDPSGHAFDAGGGATGMWDGYWDSTSPAKSATYWDGLKMSSYYKFEEPYETNPNDPIINYSIAPKWVSAAEVAMIGIDYWKIYAQLRIKNARNIDTLVGLNVNYYRNGKTTTPSITVINFSDQMIRVENASAWDTNVPLVHIGENVMVGEEAVIPVGLPPYCRRMSEEPVWSYHGDWFNSEPVEVSVLLVNESGEPSIATNKFDPNPYRKDDLMPSLIPEFKPFLR